MVPAMLCLLASCAFARESRDPALLLELLPTEQDHQQVRELFGRLLSDDFDVRAEAHQKILQFGRRALPVAKDFENSADLDTRDVARSLSAQLLLNYRGYLPVEQALSDRLEEKHRVFIGKQEPFAEAFVRFTRSTGLRVLFDGKKQPELIIGGGQTVEVNATIGEALQTLAASARLAAVVRGDAILVTTPEQAAALQIQEQAFDVDLAANDCQRLAEALQAWLPAGAKVTEGRKQLHVSGSDAHLRIAARAILLLRSGQAEMFPETKLNAEALDRVFDALRTPVSEFKMEAVEPTRGIQRLRIAGCPVELAPRSGTLAAAQPPVNLDFTGVPFGFCLRWIDERASQQPAEKQRASVQVEVDAARPMFTVDVVPAHAKRPQEETVGAADIAFLSANGQSDDALRDAVWARLCEEIDLLPAARTARGVMVFNKRLVVRGEPLAVARVLQLVEKWKAAGKAEAAEWRTKLEQRLQAEVKWNGVNVTPLTMLSALRDATGLNIILTRSDDGKTPAMQLEASQASLLEPGHHKAVALLDRLCELTETRYVVQWGVVMIEPLPKK